MERETIQKISDEIVREFKAKVWEEVERIFDRLVGEKALEVAEQAHGIVGKRDYGGIVDEAVKKITGSKKGAGPFRTIPAFRWSDE